jgi:site-specific DNA-cytosine methylase
MGKVLIACEESQTVTKEMRALGIEAYSCDIEPCSGGHPEWHIQGDVTPLLEQEWDMIIAFPPCTHLAVSGAAWFEQKRKDGRQQQGIDFFMIFANAKCDKVAIENPVGIMSSMWRKPDQIVQPWMFGHPESKATCLWLKNLPKLQPTDNVKELFDTLPKNKQQRLHYLPPSKERAVLRSKTFIGIAKALAKQYTAFINSGMTVSEWETLFNGLDISRHNAIIDKYV